MSIDLESLSEATSGAVGALVSTTVLYPLDTCKTKFQAEVQAQGNQRYRNLSDVLWEAISTRQFFSLYQGLGTKNLQSFISQFVYFYGYSYFKRLYLRNSGAKSLGTKANLILAAAAGACTVIATQPLDTVSSRMQTSAFGESKGLWETLSEGSWSEAFDGLGISLLLTTNPSIQEQQQLQKHHLDQPKHRWATFSLNRVIRGHSCCGKHCKMPSDVELNLSLKGKKGNHGTYTVFDQLKQRLLKRKSNKMERASGDSSPEALSAFSAFVLGAVSKSIATFLTYPAIRCKVMIQAAETKDETNSANSKPPTKTVAGALCAIWKREGIPGFFKGLQAQILKTVLSSALLLMIKEKISRATWVLILAIRRYVLVARGRLKNA